MRSDRKLVIGGVALVKARLKHTGPAIDSVREELERILVASDFFAGAPFDWIGLVIRYGMQDRFEPEYQAIHEVHRDLPIAIEVDTHRLLKADLETVKAVFREATLEALLDVATRYSLRRDALIAHRLNLLKS
jgi:hypothetical protein